MTLQTQPIAINESIPVGTKFRQIYEGLTVSGFGKVSKTWEVVSEEINGLCKCKALSDNTVMKLNPNYIVSFEAKEIRAALLNLKH